MSGGRALWLNGALGSNLCPLRLTARTKSGEEVPTSAYRDGRADMVHGDLIFDPANQTLP